MIPNGFWGRMRYQAKDKNWIDGLRYVYRTLNSERADQLSVRRTVPRIVGQSPPGHRKLNSSQQLL